MADEPNPPVPRGIVRERLWEIIFEAETRAGKAFDVCLLWAIMGAVDVSFTESSVGAGVSTVFFVAAVFRTTRRTKD